jgi:serine/threonine protein kinase
VLSSLNRWLFAQGHHYTDAHRGFVCTLSAIVLKSQTLHLFHVGDSRIYRLRQGRLELLSTDHKVHINETTSQLSRAMGLDVKLDVDHRSLPVERGDVYVMTTDGLHDHVASREIVAALNAQSDLTAAGQLLIDAALNNQSLDNVTCQLVRVDSLPAARSDEVHRVLAELAFPPELRPGMTLDGYRVLSELYASPRSQLYVVEDCESREKLVMKTPSVRFEDDPHYIERFVMEPWIGSRIRSSRVIRSVQAKRPPSFLYHLLEYVEGETLDAWMSRQPERDIREVVKIVEEVARGLQAFHRYETVHRDLKPDNVMIASDGRIKIVDLGACFVRSVGELAGALEGLSAGTVDYSAPELLSGETPTPRSDQYSLAVLTYELLTGHLPHAPSHGQRISPKRLTDRPYIPAYHWNPLVPVWMDGALRKALRPEPVVRYAELSEFVHDLAHPNPRFTDQAALPILERNPVLFWRSACVVLVMLQVITLCYFLGR